MKNFNIDEFEITSESIISVAENSGIVAKTAVDDFVDFLVKSFNVSVKTGCDGNIIINSDTQPYENIFFKIEISDKIYINASNDKAVAQAIYFLEDLMFYKHAPRLKKETIEKTLAFCPRIITVNSYDIETVETNLSQIAHHGFTAIQVSTRETNKEPFPALVKLCEKYGLDIYLLSHILNKYHPDDAEALEYYESTYGKILENFPQIKGIILVGESAGFPSKDPRTTGMFRGSSPDNIPETDLVDPGWFPCNDWYKLVEIIKKVTRAKNPDFDIVFWSYNWFSASDDKRLALIDSLPTDISYLCTFENGEQFKKDGITKICADYTISIAGPSKIFEVEAKRVKERGIRFYSMTSTGGATQDLPPAAYLPFPQKWIKRYEGIRASQQNYGLSGLHDGWKGFCPSIVSELSKMCFFDVNSDYDQNLRFILKGHFGEHADTVYKVFDIWSESSDYIHASYDEQYGPLRIGTAFPLCFLNNITPPPPFGTPWYNTMHDYGCSGFQTNYTVRYKTENKHWNKMAKLIKKGVDILKAIENPSDEIVQLEILGRHMYHCIKTVVNVRRWHKERNNFYANPTTNRQVARILNKMEKIAKEEIENCHQSIEVMKLDKKQSVSAISPYTNITDESVLWKIKQIEYVIKKEIGQCRDELKL